MKSKTKKVPKTPGGWHAMARELMALFKSLHLTDETRVYSHGLKLSFDKDDNVVESEYSTLPCEYGNPATMTVTSEGLLYSVMNGECLASHWTKVTDFFESRGLYVEQGHAWSFSVWPDED